MTERGQAVLSRSPGRLAIGPSAMSVDAGKLVIDVDEWTVPVPRRLRGRVTVEPGPVFHAVHALDAAGRHTWRPIAPCARVAVAFDSPALAWSGEAYVDMNAGEEPLETAFRSWTWSRAAHPEATRILYDIEPRDGTPRSLALNYGRDGTLLAEAEPPPFQPLPTTGWRVARGTRADPSRPAKVVRTLEDTPFYSRSLLGFGADEGQAIHESVDLDRFASRWVQMLLPFKMPRRG